MSKIIRKTPTMIMMEYKHGIDIEELLLTAIIESRGQQKEASENLDISEASLCRWIHDLDLTKKVAQIRKKNGLPPTVRDLGLKYNGKELIEIAVIERCSDCDAKFEDLISHTITGINHEKDKIFAVVRDELHRKHKFALDLSEALV